jgi:hypothetical protein
MTQGMDSTRRRSSVSQGPVTTSGGTWRKNPSKARPIDSRSLFVLSGAMSVIFEINRDFPYQVPLAFDEDAMDVLDWLEGREFQWDLYVDLPENTIRYCFRTLDDASAFKRRFGDASQGRAVASGH